MRLSVVTRTCRRPLLLERAARSVAAAQVESMEWILVDDDNTIARNTEQIAQETRRATGITVKVLGSENNGRTRAANIGLGAAEGAYIHFHDDDDTVEPAFYRATLDFLRDNERYRAVRAMCRRIYEEVSGETLRTIKSQRVYPERRTVSLLDAAEVFAYPPIGTVFDRKILTRIGGFDERFDVGEDYNLLLRFLLKADVGTIPQCLANVHLRSEERGVYANSPISRNFLEEYMLFHNLMLRDDIENNRVGLGWLLALGTLRRKNRTLLDFLDVARKRVGL